MVHSKLQLEVLKLYKELLRAAANKPGVEENVRTEFRRQAWLPRSDSLRIEYSMRMGRRKLQLMKDRVQYEDGEEEAADDEG
jgi:succinate dehydrogenase assembly factor 1